MKKSVDLFMFDLDGTLADTGRDLANSVNFTRGKFGLTPMSPDSVYTHIGRGVEHLLRQTLPEVHRGHFSEVHHVFIGHYERHLLDQTALYPGIRELLESFSGKHRAVVSNKIYRLTVTMLRGLGIEDCFDAVFGGDSAAEKKPHPALLNAALKRFHLPASSAIMIGDGDVDIQAGKHAGVLTCGVTYGLGSNDELLAAKPDVIINHPAELADYFF